MTDTVVVIDSDDVVVVDTTEQLHVVTLQEDLQVVSVGEPGPPGTGNDDGEDGQVWTARNGSQGWEDQAVTGATPADIARVLAFAARH